MNGTEPTYFLYSGRLFHEAALPALSALLQPHRGNDSANPPLPRRGESTTTRTPQPRRGEDPSPAGPEDEPVGEEPDEDGDGGNAESKPSPGPGLPMVPEHGSPDADPIDPRVF